MTETINTTEAAFYVGTYKKYNEGSLFGKWIKFSDYNSAADFYNACTELHKDESDPELMAQDYEYLPKSLYSESFSIAGIEAIYKYLEIAKQLENYSISDWINLHNRYCAENATEDEIYIFDDEFFNMFFEKKPMEAARAASFGDVNWSDDYITFNGYGNLVSYNKHTVESMINETELINAVIENPQDYDL